MKKKIKYIPWVYKHNSNKLIKEGYEVVENPFGINMKDGEYWIRGNQKFHAKRYWVIDGIWFLMYDITKDGWYNILAGNYQLYPSLSEKEWDLLNNPIVYKKLSPYWKRAVFGRNQWMNLRETRRDTLKTFIKFDKENQ